MMKIMKKIAVSKEKKMIMNKKIAKMSVRMRKMMKEVVLLQVRRK